MQFIEHTGNVHEDPRIEKLIEEKGYEGYGRYWGIIERLLRAEGNVLDLSQGGLVEQLQRILRFETKEELREFLQYLSEIGLVHFARGFIFSDAIEDFRNRESERRTSNTSNARAVLARSHEDRKNFFESKGCGYHVAKYCNQSMAAQKKRDPHILETLEKLALECEVSSEEVEKLRNIASWATAPVLTLQANFVANYLRTNMKEVDDFVDYLEKWMLRDKGKKEGLYKWKEKE